MEIGQALSILVGVTIGSLIVVIIAFIVIR